MTPSHSRRPILTVVSSGRQGPQALLARSIRNHVEAAQRLTRDPDQAGKFVHQLRTGVKRLRACWRLLRPAIPDSDFRRENLRLRNVAQRLAAARERDVIPKTLDKLLERPLSEKDSRLVSAARHDFLARTRAEKDGGKDIQQEALSVLSESLRRLGERDLGDWGWENVRVAIERSYRKARKAYRQADSGRGDDANHAWRKRTKDLWYQLDALAPELPAAGRSKASLEKLQGCLGDAQDLAVLEERMAQRPRAYGGTHNVAAMRGPLRREKRKLTRKCLRRGGRFFRPKARRFVRKLDIPAGRIDRTYAKSA